MSQSGKSACRRLAAATILSAIALAATGPARAGSTGATLSVRVVVVAPCGSGGPCEGTPSGASLASPPAEEATAPPPAPLVVRDERVGGRSYRTIVY
ncbi:MAG TPA: hypothetical protein ENJ38_04425 [Rhodospirillales bacterium]|nr:hypothetical protein [Rhodospirillales bacterium]